MPSKGCKDGNGSDTSYTTTMSTDIDKVEEMKEEGAVGAVQLKKSFGLLQGCTIIIGTIIGSGIFISPNGLLKQVGSTNMSLVVWAVSGLFSMIGSYCYAELGLLIRKPGGDYIYILESLGPFIGFVRLWTDCLIVLPCSITIISLTFAKYSVKLFFPECEPPDVSVRLLAACCICLITFINCWSVKFATLVQDVFTGAKLLALFIIIITGFVQLGKGKVDNFSWDNTEDDVSKIGVSFYSGLFAYYGWSFLNYVMEELKDPVKNFPLALGISITIVTVVYILTVVAFYTTLSTPEVLGSEAVAVTFADRLYGNFTFIIPVFVALSCFGGVNGVLLSTSRLFYAAACEGQMPQIMSMIQVKRMTPAPAILIEAMLALVYLAFSDIGTLITYSGIAVWLSIGLAVFCVLWLRWKHPEWKRPIKVNPIFPILYVLITLFITLSSLIAETKNTGIGLAIMATSVPVYFIFIYWKNKPKFFKRASDSSTRFLQKLLLVVPDETKR